MDNTGNVLTLHRECFTKLERSVSTFRILDTCTVEHRALGVIATGFANRYHESIFVTKLN